MYVFDEVAKEAGVRPLCEVTKAGRYLGSVLCIFGLGRPPHLVTFGGRHKVLINEPSLDVDSFLYFISWFGDE